MKGTAVENQCNRVYDYLRNDDGLVSISSFLELLERKGVLSDDPRIQNCITKTQEYENLLQQESFMSCISENISIIIRALTNSNIICDFETFIEDIEDIYRTCSLNVEGEVGDAVPHLPCHNREHFGISVCTVDGQRHNVGDTDVDFCLYSCAKPINYCIALEEHEKDKIHEHVGSEPSIAADALELNDMKLPHNPIINSGAIMICSLIQSHVDPKERFQHIANTWKKLAGGQSLGYSKSIFQTQRTTGYRNFAMAYIMEENKTFPKETNLIEVLETYFKCRSLTVKCNMLSIVAASLANGGVCPLTNERVFSPGNVKYCLSAMYASGLYEHSGEFVFTCGLPGSSSTSGAVFVVIPNVMGICTYSPRLDEFGNSVRGMEFFSRLTKRFSFHLLQLSNEDEQTNPTEEPEDITMKIIKYCSLGDLCALKRLRVTHEVLNEGDYDKRTSLHLAASNGHLNVVAYLVNRLGVSSINPLDRWGGTPYDDALREKHYELAQFLRDAGGKRGIDLLKGT